MIQKHVPGKNLCQCPSLFSDVSIPRDSSVASGWKCKAEGDGDAAMTSLQDRAQQPLIPPVGLTDLRGHMQGFLWKQTKCGMWSAGPCWDREKVHQGNLFWCCLYLDLGHTMGFWIPRPFSQLEKGRPSKKVIWSSVAGYWCNTYNVLHLPHCQSCTKQITDMGTGLENLGYEICLEHASTLHNHS